MITDHIKVGINEGFAEINADKDYFCKGDTINLTCSESTLYFWSSVPADLSLSSQVNM